MAPTPSPFDSDAALAGLVDDFEHGIAPEGGFSHRAHLAVALAYLDRYGEEGAIEHMRAGLLRFLELALGDPVAARVKYRETMTVFWVRLLAAGLAGTDPALPLHRRIAPLLERYGDASVIRSYYSQERLESDEARTRYLEPDLRPLPTT